MMYMDNPITSRKPDETYADCSVICINGRYYRVPNVLLDYVKNQEDQITSLYEDMAGEDI